jgi:hypothetical protein
MPQRTCHKEHVTKNMSQRTCHKEHVTKNMSQRTCHKEHVTKNMSQRTCHKEIISHFFVLRVTWSSHRVLLKVNYSGMLVILTSKELILILNCLTLKMKVLNWIRKLYLTFRGRCIVMYSYNGSQRDALFLKFILIKNSTCFGQIYWSRVSTLYTQLTSTASIPNTYTNGPNTFFSNYLPPCCSPDDLTTLYNTNLNIRSIYCFA